MIVHFEKGVPFSREKSEQLRFDYLWSFDVGLCLFPKLPFDFREYLTIFKGIIDDLKKRIFKTYEIPYLFTEKRAKTNRIISHWNGNEFSYRKMDANELTMDVLA